LRVVERGRGDGDIIGSLSGDRGGGDAVGSRQRRRKQKKRKGEGRMGGGGGSGSGRVREVGRWGDFFAKVTAGGFL
jgi:hypothetical protein